KRTAARSSNGAAGAAACHCRRRLGENAHPHVSRGVLARERDRSAKYSAPYVHEQSCAGNAASRRESAASGCRRTLGRNISFPRKQDLAQARQRARLLERI